MTIEEKLKERLLVQGWNVVAHRKSTETQSFACNLVRPDGWVAFVYDVNKRPGELTAEKATEIEAWFKEKLRDE